MQNNCDQAENSPSARQMTASFRAWVQDSLAVLGVSAASICRDLGLGRNTLADFLRDPARDIRMGTAHVITCKLRELATKQAVALPRLQMGFDNA